MDWETAHWVDGWSRWSLWSFSPLMVLWPSWFPFQLGISWFYELMGADRAEKDHQMGEIHAVLSGSLRSLLINLWLKSWQLLRFLFLHRPAGSKKLKQAHPSLLCSPWLLHGCCFSSLTANAAWRFYSDLLGRIQFTHENHTPHCYFPRTICRIY